MKILVIFISKILLGFNWALSLEIKVVNENDCKVFLFEIF
jgi:hypothetical protein